MASELKRFDVFSPDIYVALTNWLWHDAPALDPKARGVFLALAGSFNPDLKTHIGIDRMADRTGWSRKSVQRGLAELEDAGVIEVQRRFANSSEITLADEVAYSVNLTERETRVTQPNRRIFVSFQGKASLTPSGERAESPSQPKHRSRKRRVLSLSRKRLTAGLSVAGALKSRLPPSRRQDNERPAIRLRLGGLPVARRPSTQLLGRAWHEV